MLLPVTRPALTTVVLLLAIGLAACSQRPVGQGNENTTVDAGAVECVDLWDCNPGVTCGELVMCEQGRCRPDLGHVIIPCTAGECTADADCVVAEPVTCCFGCPEVLSREVLAERECFYEQGQAPETIPPECDMDCFYCEACVPQPLGARCDAGACVPTDLGCPDFSEQEQPTVTTEQLQQNAAAHAGERRWVRGAVLPDEGSCDGEGCSTQYRSLLNGVVRLDGTLCDLPLGLTGDECRANLTGNAVQPGGWYEFEGIVHEAPSAWEPPWLEVTGSRIVEPADLGGRYAVVVTAVESDANDPVCTPPYWAVGDALDLIVGVSGPQVRVAAPTLHCEANFSGGFDAGTGDRFTVWLPIDCDLCEFAIQGEVDGEQLRGHYFFLDGTCQHTVRFEGPRVR